MKRSPYLLVVILALFLASCGEAGPTTTINVLMTDFMFQPSQFIVPAGEQITVNTSNNGAVVHNFVIMKLGETAGPMFDEEDVPNVYWEVEIQPGGSTDTSFPAPAEPGEYEVICRTEGHIASGMIARLVVVAGE
ncbi:MAG: cupredoxin domain-containing protein [Chloroflexota bacterium]|nr:cupredoxin domain-containing protein [Chloroflexota bacterium]